MRRAGRVAPREHRERGVGWGRFGNQRLLSRHHHRSASNTCRSERIKSSLKTRISPPPDRPSAGHPRASFARLDPAPRSRSGGIGKKRSKAETRPRLRRIDGWTHCYAASPGTAPARAVTVSPNLPCHMTRCPRRQVPTGQPVTLMPYMPYRIVQFYPALRVIQMADMSVYSVASAKLNGVRLARCRQCSDCD
jgi:hypothetical protein